MTTNAHPVRTPSPGVRHQEDIVISPAARKALAATRIIIGFGFLWPFLDKLFGLRYATPPEGAWINGGAPAQGYISCIEGPFAGFFSLFGNSFGDWFFMLGLLGIGVAMIAGAGLRIAAIGGTILLLFMYSPTFPQRRQWSAGRWYAGRIIPSRTHTGMRRSC